MKKDVDMMKTRYIIGFFAAFLILALMLSAGYQMTYEHVARRQTAREDTSDTQSITAEGEAVKETGEEAEEDGQEGYYLCELQGFVVVYLNDRKTIYEMTEIPVMDLPEEVQNEIASGKYVSSQEELYGFLENYSS